MKAATPYVLFAMLFASLCSATVAAADTDHGPPQRTVKFADLDLTRNSGITTLYARIKTAARAVCEPEGEYGLSSVQAEMACRARAVSGAVDKVNLPLLTSYHREHSGTSNDKSLRLAETALEQPK